ncbi:MAG TPA: hypothetical protein VGG09_00485 [Acidimicrobiales bacterium]
MKFSFRQILASAAGAVLAALIASSFGVTGTIIGVAIGSVAATMGSALISQSIDRGHKAVKQVVVRVPQASTSPLLRRLGGTRTAGTAQSSGDAGAAAPTEVVASEGDKTTQMESGGASADETRKFEISAVADAPSTEHLQASTTRVPPVPPVPPTGEGGVAGAARQPGGRRFSWKVIAGTAAIVFVLAIGFVTAIELIANKPLASIFGSTGSGPTLKNLFNPPPATSTTTTTSTTAPASTTSTTSSSSTTTSSTTTTTAPSTTGLSSTTTTTSPGPTTTVPLFGTTTTSKP